MSSSADRRHQPPPADVREAAAGQARLQKVLAASGLGSRRSCEGLIAAGRVTVNGGVAQLGQRVSEADKIRVDGETVVIATDRVYVALNKPRGVQSTMHDDRGRPSVGDIAVDLPAAVHHVGRLDAETEGLLLLTNDGTLSHRLLHPSYGVAKTYVAQVDGVLSRQASRALRSGVELDDGPAKADAVAILDSTATRSVVRISVHEGRNRLVRRMLEAVGHPVQQLTRISIGTIHLGDLKTGRYRHLQPAEVRSLYRDVDL